MWGPSHGIAILEVFAKVPSLLAEKAYVVPTSASAAFLSMHPKPDQPFDFLKNINIFNLVAGKSYST